MCEQCGNPSCTGDVQMGELFVAAAGRVDAAFTAAAGLAERPLGDHAVMETDDAARAVASMLGLSFEEVRAYVVSRAALETRDSVRAFITDGSGGLEASMRSALMPALALGWAIRDEQLKAERAANAPSA